MGRILAYHFYILRLEDLRTARCIVVLTLEVIETDLVAFPEEYSLLYWR